MSDGPAKPALLSLVCLTSLVSLTNDVAANTTNLADRSRSPAAPRPAQAQPRASSRDSGFRGYGVPGGAPHHDSQVAGDRRARAGGSRADRARVDVRRGRAARTGRLRPPNGRPARPPAAGALGHGGG